MRRGRIAREGEGLAGLMWCFGDVKQRVEGDKAEGIEQELTLRPVKTMTECCGSHGSI